MRHGDESQASTDVVVVVVQLTTVVLSEVVQGGFACGVMFPTQAAPSLHKQVLLFAHRTSVPELVAVVLLLHGVILLSASRRDKQLKFDWARSAVHVVKFNVHSVASELHATLTLTQVLLGGDVGKDVELLTQSHVGVTCVERFRQLTSHLV